MSPEQNERSPCSPLRTPARSTAVENTANRQDLLDYLSAVTAHDPLITDALRRTGMPADRFCQTLLDRSGGVWIYALTVLDQIRDHDRNPADVDRLPAGLAGYYADTEPLAHRASDGCSAVIVQADLPRTNHRLEERVLRILSAVVCGVALVSLAGCSSAKDGDVGPPTNPPVAAGPFENFQQRSGVAAFVVAFRAAFPALADGRSDEDIASDVTHICLDDLRDPSTGQPAREAEAVALRRIPSRFERNGITPDWTTSRTILAFAKGTACSPVEVSGS